MAAITDTKTYIPNIFRRVRSPKTKLLITVAVVIGFVLGGNGVTRTSPFSTHLAYGFLHANLFHLLCNLFVLWTIRGKMSALEAFVVSVLCSYLPQYVTSPTVGMSGFLFAVFGIMWGKTGLFLKSMKAGFPFILLTMFLPGLNGTLHFYCYICGFICGFLHRRMD